MFCLLFEIRLLFPPFYLLCHGAILNSDVHFLCGFASFRIKSVVSNFYRFSISHLRCGESLVLAPICSRLLKGNLGVNH